MNESKDTRCGYVTLVGRPNVGKSTLLNQMLGEKLAIISPKPQTTRNRIPGVLTRDETQIVFLDTPGLHSASGLLNSYMVDVAQEAMWDTDVVALIVEAGMGKDGSVGVSKIIQGVLDSMRERSKPIVLVLNKIDRFNREQLLPIIDAWRSVYEFKQIVPVSALEGDGVEGLLDVLSSLLPQGPMLYPVDALTDLPERFIASEIIREQLFLCLERELPYCVAVQVEAWRDRGLDGCVDIEAVIAVERDSQKGIVIGKGAQMLKRIGVRARKSIEKMLGVKVNLKLFVRVERGWTRSAKRLKKFGYEK